MTIEINTESIVKSLEKKIDKYQKLYEDEHSNPWKKQKWMLHRIPPLKEKIKKFKALQGKYEINTADNLDEIIERIFDIDENVYTIRNGKRVTICLASDITLD